MLNLSDNINIESLQRLLLYDPRNPLLFNTGLFLILFVVFLGIYRLLRHATTLRKVFVILFSLYFYYKSSAECCFILLGVCLSDYLLGLLLGSVKANWLRRGIVALNVCVNVGMLVYFKYFNLLLDTFAGITGTRFDVLDIILPAGISFFTFRSISYLVDIYRGHMAPCRNLLDYTFYLTFFPPLLAGPVVRAKDMLPQVRENKEATDAMVSEALFLIMMGSSVCRYKQIWNSAGYRRVQHYSDCILPLAFCRGNPQCEFLGNPVCGCIYLHYIR